MNNIPNTHSTRMPYIDKLKALAMLMVVMGHTIYFCMYHESKNDDSIFKIICTFHVPLFFFLSGFVISNAPNIRKFLRKAYSFLMPMLIVGFINAIVIGRINTFFTNGGHNGYWYLLTLTIFYFFIIPFYITNHKKSLIIFSIDCLMAMGIWFFIILIMHLFDDYLSSLNIWAAYAFWPFFISGYLFRKYSIADFIYNKPWLTVITSFVYLLLISVYFKNMNDCSIYIDFTLAFLAILSFLAIFHSFSYKESFFDKQLIIIGKNTLNIYIYHYFFIYFIHLDFLKTQNIIIEFLIISMLTICIVYASIAIGKIIKIDRLTNK